MLVLSLVTISGLAQDLKGTRPNIVVILMDDMGYSDLGCYGSEIRTPNLDAMAARGMKLTNLNTYAVCSHTRGSLISGNMYRRHDTNTLLPEKLNEVGYQTIMVGKGHIGDNYKKFDQFFGFKGGATNYFTGGDTDEAKFIIYENEIETDFTDLGPDFYSTDEFTNRSINYIEQTKNNDPNKPFFLFLSQQAPHSSLQVPEEDIKKYRGQYLRGWKEIRDNRVTNMKRFGILDNDIAASPFASVLPDWDALTPFQRDQQDLRMAVYAAMIERVDIGIGKIVNALRDMGELNNTIFLFLSDNGSNTSKSAEIGSSNQEIIPGAPDSNWFVGTGWGHVSNAPFKHDKQNLTGGGANSCGIVYWPDQIKPEDLMTSNSNPKGAINKSMIHVRDIMPTLLELAFPVNQQDELSIFNAQLYGKSFLPVLQTENYIPRTDTAIRNLFNDRSVMTDQWTLLEHNRSGNTEQWELYDNYEDPTELNDIAASFPGVVTTLSTYWEDNNAGPFRPSDHDIAVESNNYTPSAFKPNVISDRFGYLEAIASNFLTPTQATQNPGSQVRPEATVFRGEYQYNTSDLKGINGYAIPFQQDGDVTHRLILKKEIPARVRLDIHSFFENQSTIFEYPNVPSSIGIYTGDPLALNWGENFQQMNKVNTMNQLINANETSWFWQDGTAYLNYITGNQAIIESAKPGADNIYLCLYDNCVNGDTAPVTLSAFDTLDGLSSLEYNGNLILATDITAVNGGNTFIITKKGVDNACVNYVRSFATQNWESMQFLNIKGSGLAEGFVRLITNDQKIDLGSLCAGNSYNQLPLPSDQTLLKEIIGIEIEFCESTMENQSQEVFIDEITMNEINDNTSQDCMVLSVEDIKPKEKIKVGLLPNPVEDRLMFTDGGSRSWSVSTLQGKMILKGNSSEINMSLFSSGLYLIHTEEKVLKVLKK